MNPSDYSETVPPAESSSFLVRFKSLDSVLGALVDDVARHAAQLEEAWEAAGVASADSDGCSKNLWMQERLDRVSERLDRAKAVVKNVHAALGEAMALPPEGRTRALDDSVAHYATLFRTHAKNLDAYDATIKAHLAKHYSRPGEISVLATFVANNPSLVATAAMFLAFALLMPVLLKYRPRKTKKSRRKPQQPRRAPWQAAGDEEAEKATPQREAARSKRPPIRSKKMARKTNGYKTGAPDEMRRCKVRWMERVHRVHTEARGRFKQIRQELDAMNLQRSPPKDKKPSHRGDPRVAPACHASLANDGGKAGRSQYLIMVGAVDHLHKTSKPCATRARGRSLLRIPCVDLHGMTQAAALGELNARLPRWIEAAMRGPYPWVMPVRIVCGGGNQVLSEAVAHWIREMTQVTKAPKNLVL